MATISFNEIPNNIRIPLFTAEFDNSNAVRGAQNQIYKALIIGQKLPAGTQAVLVPVRVSGKQDAINKFGAGSTLAEMAAWYRDVDPITELFAIAVPDDAAGVKAKAAIAVTGTASEPGALYAYINGSRFTVPVRSGDTAADIHAAFAERMNAVAAIPAVAAVSADKITLEAKQPGEFGNDIDVRFNYNAGEYTPAGIAVAISEFSSGGANPDITDALAAVSGEWFNAFMSPYADANNMYILNEHLKMCWGPLVMREGWNFVGKRGSFGELCEYGLSRNSPHECIMHCRGFPNSPWAVAASAAANVMRYGNIDPARPFQTLPLAGILAPRLEDRFNDITENNQLLYNGIATNYADDGGTVRIGRLITTYKTTANGAEDISYLDVNTGLTLGYLRWDLRNYFMRKYPRHKLADDGTLYAAGQAIMTPKLAKAECVNKFQDWVARGLVENIRQFKDELIVERDDADPNRLNFRLPPDLMNQFRVGAVQIQFYL